LTASPRDGPLTLGGQDRRELVDEAASLAAASSLDLRLEDLGPTLDEPAQQRQVLALGVALVAPGPEVLQREPCQALDELGPADPVDPSVPALLAHGGAS
jgi:hypothetical protein